MAEEREFLPNPVGLSRDSLFFMEFYNLYNIMLWD
jgi:hypothetical protein